MVPTAIAEVSRPYWLASPSNCVTDMVEMKIAKLKPNVPSNKSITSTATRSGRCHTYRNPASRLPRVRSGKARSEEHTSELQSLMRISYAVFCLKKKKTIYNKYPSSTIHNKPPD